MTPSAESSSVFSAPGRLARPTSSWEHVESSLNLKGFLICCIASSHFCCCCYLDWCKEVVNYCHPLISWVSFQMRAQNRPANNLAVEYELKFDSCTQLVSKLGGWRRRLLTTTLRCSISPNCLEKGGVRCMYWGHSQKLLFRDYRLLDEAAVYQTIEKEARKSFSSIQWGYRLQLA